MKSGWDVRLPAYGFRRPALIRNAFYVGESLVDLRREANDSGLIQTVPKKGYVFNGIVTPAVEGDAPRAEPRVRWLRPAASFVLVLLAAGATISALLLTSRDRGPGWEIRPLTSFDGVELFPSWSPDGSLVAFSHDAFGNLDVFVMPSLPPVVTRFA